MSHCHGAASLASANRLLSAFLASFENKPVKVYDINKTKPHKMEWAEVQPQHVMTTASDKGLFSALTTYNAKIWELFQYSLPPFPAAKYYKVEHDHQMPSDNILCVSLSYMFWIDCLGISALSAIQKNSLDTLGGSKKPSSKKLKSWAESADCTIKIAKMTFKGEHVDEIGSRDVCTKAEELLLEPSMLIQLPWKPVLLHSWLQAALYEIQKFELESLELRHWPLTEDTYALSNNLMSTMCKLKERVMLGFAIVNDVISSYTTKRTDDSFADIILDIVVLPSIPMLEFLLKGHVSKIIQNIKETSFATSHTEVRSADLLYINFNSYRMMSPLSTLSSEFAFNFNIWTSEVISNLFPLLSESIHEMAKKICDNTPKDTSRETNLVKPMTLDEKCLLAIVEKQLKVSGLSSDERITLTIKAINDRVLEKGYLPSIAITDIKKKFNSAKSKKMAGEIFEKVKFDYVHHAIRQALMYHQAYKLQIVIDTYHSTPAQIIAQQLLILEQEQLARLANTCALMFHVTPMIPKPLPVKSSSKRRKSKKANKAAREAAEGDPVKEPLDLPTQFQMASEKQINRDMLWKSVPVDWQEDVDETEEVPGTCQNIHDVIDMLCMKVGRIVHSTAQEKFRRVQPFSDWTLIQTVLPSLVKSLVEDPSVLEKAQDFCFFPLIASTIQLYEALHNSNLTEGTKPEDSKGVKAKKSKNDNSLICQYEEWFVLTKKVTSDINAIIRLLYTFTAGKSKKFRDKFKSFCKFIALNYHQMYSTSSVPFIQVLECFQNWHPNILRFLCRVSLMGNDDYVLAQPGSPMPSYPELGDLYFATEVIMEITTAINMMAPYTTPDNPIPPEISQTDFRFRSLILSHVMLEHRNIKTPDGKRILHLDEDKPTLDIYDLYQTLKKWRNSIGDMECTLHRHLPMCQLFPAVKEAVNYFISGDLDALEERVAVFRDEDSDGEELEPYTLCRNCGKCEGGKKFIVCEKCLEDQYPDVNYYCGKKCKDMWWKTEHMAEHLEFDLGLSDFSHLNPEEECNDEENSDDYEDIEDEVTVEEQSDEDIEHEVSVKYRVQNDTETAGKIEKSQSVQEEKIEENSENTELQDKASGGIEQSSGEVKSVEKTESQLDSGSTEHFSESSENDERSEEHPENSVQVCEDSVKVEKCLEQKSQNFRVSHEAQKPEENLTEDVMPTETVKLEENSKETLKSEDVSSSQTLEESIKLEEKGELETSQETAVMCSEIEESSENVESLAAANSEPTDTSALMSNGLEYSVESCCDNFQACKIDEILLEQQNRKQVDLQQCNVPVNPETVIST